MSQSNSRRSTGADAMKWSAFAADATALRKTSA
jgi:hypothetical protein